MKNKITFKNALAHFHKIQKHRKYVRHYCFLASIPWRGITHDLSKYSPIEFWESVKFYKGISSPINEAKKLQGISYAWLHHKGRNSHHYEYWMDNFDNGGLARLMPKNDFVELVCDYLGAAAAYGKVDDHFYAREREWWKTKRENCAMHEKNKIMLDIIFSDLEKAENPMLIDLEDEFRHWIPTPEKLIKTGYIQKVWEANSR